MDVWSPKLHLAAWTVLNLICVFSHEVTVRNSDLKACENNKKVCVTDLRDCVRQPPSSVQQDLNMSCYYKISDRSMTCEWSEESNSHTEPEASLIFSSKVEILSCWVIFSPISVLNVTARIKNILMGSEIWSQPLLVFLHDAVKPSQPVLTVLGATADSINVTWRSSSGGSCRLRYRADHANIWTEAPDSVPAHQDQTLTYEIRGLLPFTVFRAAVACRGKSKIWSDWSPDVTSRTLDRVPSRPLEVVSRVEKAPSAESLFLHLMWKDLDHHDAGDHILGYQVSYKPAEETQLQDGFLQNVTEVTALLVVEEGNYTVTVKAFNMAGYGPAAHLSINTQRQKTLPSVRNLWVSSSFPALKSLLVRWENPTVPPSAPPVSHFAVQWRSETRPSTGRWTTVDSFSTSTLIQDVDPDESYLISVAPVYNQQCGSPQSLPASLQQGALMEAVKLKVVGVTKTTVTVAWVWQRKTGSIREYRIRVDSYRLTLREDSERQTLSLWPDQWQHTFTNLKPNTEYSLLLKADNVPRGIVSVRTEFDEVPVVATVTPLVVLAVFLLIISILSRTVYKSYFFPHISSPRDSATGQWLMDPNHQQKTAGRNILEIEDFQVTDVLGEKSLITIGPNSLHTSEEAQHEDTSLLSISHLIKLSTLKLDTEYISDAPFVTERQLVSLESYHADYAVDFVHLDGVFISEDSQTADNTLLCQKQEANGGFLEKQEEGRQVDLSERSHQTEAAVNWCFHEFEANANSHCAYQMTCETEYITSGYILKQ